MNRSTMIVAAVLFFAASLAFGQDQKQRDFEAAVEAADKELGCATIPFSDLKGNCEDQQKGVKEWCDGQRDPLSVN